MVTWTVHIGAHLQSGHGLRWKDCASDPLNAALTFNSLKIWPFPVLIPGDVHFSVDVTVNREVHKLYIDEDVDEIISKFYFTLPCVGEGIGSCSDIDSCHYRDQNVPDIWETFMFYMLGNDTDCPIPSKSVVIQDEMVNIPSLPMEIANMANRMFQIRLHFKDDKASKDHIGCLEFDFEFDLSPSFLSGLG
ncbi:uncharacterized protein LOC123522908 isoform X2 [Mercenaria mercenaria]|uniref:uncharacterized protein LOC123522908 isoform X2 n=1 Tax=Mercenaria mercenaria TaxID=6596 RepID=UPI001E1E0187|nr:uncharacterized protein LOC123522908 isoform X2 [Mercenaria mercenaria]